MRIKKVSQTTATQAQVVNNKNNSQLNAYSCDYVNNLAGKILWTNENPTISFSSQTVTLSSSDYDFIEIIYKTATNATECYSSGKLLKGYGTKLFDCYAGAQYTYGRSRDMVYVSDTSLTFDDGKRSTYGNAGTDNNMIIPLYIIGYKTGLFS